MAAAFSQYQKSKIYDLPPNTVLLGSFIQTPAFADEVLNRGQIVPIEPKPIPVIYPNWKDTVDNVQKGKIGIWARFIQTVTAGFEVGASGNNDNSYEYSFEKLETTSFYTDQAYLNEALRQPSIKAYLEASDYRPIYIVTGVKAVRGANNTVKATIARKREVNLNIGVSAAAFGAPITIGPEAKGSASKKQVVSFGGPSDAGSLTDFVIGYRLRGITFEKGDSWATKSENYLGGEMIGGATEDVMTIPESAEVMVDNIDLLAEKEWAESD
jgi:hypothetical protein